MSFFSKRIAIPACALLTWSCAGGPGREVEPTANMPASMARYPIEDPFEPVNRATWQVNRAVIVGVLDPLSAAYVTLVPDPARKSVGRVRDNLGGPSRMLNQALQGRWEDSGKESLRFLANTTLGVGGIFDVADDMNLPGSKGSFQQTFHHWGMRPTTYLVLPALGPSDEVHAVATILDIASDPTNYIADLAAVGHVTRFHRFSEIAPSAAALYRTEPDSYQLLRQARPFLARTSPPDWTPQGPPDPATLESLSAAMSRLEDPLFAKRAQHRRARISATRRNLPYSLWLQPEPAPLVFLAPGVGSHRLSSNTLLLAETIHRMGYSVVTISGIFHPEFMERASTAPMPGNPSRDRADMLAAWTAIDAAIERRFRGRVTGRVLTGFSLGGFLALQLAATEEAHAPDSVDFDRYVAIQAPVDLRYAYDKLDDFADVPNRWPEAERAERVDRTFHKIAAMLNGGPPEGVLPFDADESRFLVGHSFRTVLRDAIFSLQRRGLCNGLCESGSTWRREPIYRKLMEIRFDEYDRDWLQPAERKLGVSGTSLAKATSLESMERNLRRHSSVRLIQNRNDFLLSERDRQWIDRTFAGRAVWLPGGGHLGNLNEPELREALARALRP